MDDNDVDYEIQKKSPEKVYSTDLSLILFLSYNHHCIFFEKSIEPSPHSEVFEMVEALQWRVMAVESTLNKLQVVPSLLMPPSYDGFFCPKLL